MKTLWFLPVAFVVIFLWGCDEGDSKVLPENSDLKFSGTFKTTGVDRDYDGTVWIDIADGYYRTGTNVPYGVGAGKLEVGSGKINFVDTLFFVVPMIYYGPTSVPSGELRYNFDGETLKMWRTWIDGKTVYELKVVHE